MGATEPNIEHLDTRVFADRVGIELQRAERYRIFVSLTVLDLEFTRDLGAGLPFDLLAELGKRVRSTLRSCDYVALVNGHCLALLFPETPRQGAEIAARRVAGLLSEEAARLTGREVRQVIPVEIASYPDTAGARTMAEFLEEMARKSRN